MPENAELQAGFFKIISVAAKGDPLVGVDPTKPASQPVLTDARVHIWKITPQEESGVYRLSLRHSYPFTGVDDERRVIATTEAADDKEWCIKHWKEHGGAFSIELNTHIWPASAWTLSSRENPSSKISIGHYEIYPWETQLFRIEAIIE